MEIFSIESEAPICDRALPKTSYVKPGGATPDKSAEIQTLKVGFKIFAHITPKV
jgi:hypothetical protein